MQVRLTEQEDKICTLLDECTAYIKETEGSQTSCRIAGGWVRDKLLGLDSNDIDVALSDMMGVTFATHFVHFCSNVKGLQVKEVAKISSNPEQSKHLETARTTVLEYSEDSRIPTRITYGTPLQDALRRDITINALFYNVHTRTVEDHTGKGLVDLKQGFIRTPLDPLETFRDDPLRVLRSIRFGARFGFDVDRKLKKAAREAEIQEALGLKISKERIGHESAHVEHIARDPLRALDLLLELSLYSTVFQAPQSAASSQSLEPVNHALAAGSIFRALCNPDHSPNLTPVHATLVDPFEKNMALRGRLYLACALTPYRDITYTDASGKHHPASEIVIHESLKLGAQHHYLDGVPWLFRAWKAIAPAVADLAQGQSPDDRRKIGVFLRQRTIHSPPVIQWEISLLFSLVQDLLPFWNPYTNLLDETKASERIAVYNALVTKVEALGLTAMVDAKPMLNGREVLGALNAPPGPWVAPVLSSVMEWQLDHPEGTKDECLEWLKAEHAAGNIDMSVPAKPQFKRASQSVVEEHAAVKRAKPT
ncbi:uncharacterized protein B0H18DRAFT_1086105 [Fomitopsis serialis]|uniref:uncharacterized protein n=1 Tax=Fomitopsis serialis TaxID=139415 RepID=UPI002008005C|nr:uncharacterized protein B0H18DRAFT_1086105 [Neoantrodia serialis]KAH9921394.1 hypothetical protein B0H18DRAFT_1086105 [Neoantrodia serialis]